MTGITVHTESPINANTASKAQEPTAGPTTQTTPAHATATATAYTANSAQMASAVPTPSAAASAYTPTQTAPHPPQPGQVPDRGRAMPQRSVAPIQTQAPQPTQDLSHPPGYVQNHQASFEDRDMDAGNKTHTPSPTRGRGILDGAPLLRNADEDSPIWDTAMNWAKEAGRKLSVVEGEVWKKINGEK